MIQFVDDVIHNPMNFFFHFIFDRNLIYVYPKNLNFANGGKDITFRNSRESILENLF